MAHIAAINPTVPYTRTGGKWVTVSMPACARQEYEIVFDSAIVGIKAMALTSITQNISPGSLTCAA